MNCRLRRQETREKLEIHVSSATPGDHLPFVVLHLDYTNFMYKMSKFTCKLGVSHKPYYSTLCKLIFYMKFFCLFNDKF
jgi:hypothetical protein